MTHLRAMVVHSYELVNRVGLLFGRMNIWNQILDYIFEYRLIYILLSTERGIKLRLTIMKNKEMYLQEKEDYGNVPFWHNIEEYDLELQQKYNHKVL